MKCATCAREPSHNHVSRADAIEHDNVPGVQYIAAEVPAVPRAVLAVQGLALKRPNVRLVPAKT